MDIVIYENQFLSTLSKLADLPKKCRQDLVSFAKLLEAPKGTVLVREGEVKEKVFYILKGVARHYHLRKNKDVTSGFAFENTFICPSSSFYFGLPSPTCIGLLEDSLYFEFNRKDIAYLESTYHAFETLSRVYLAKTLTEVQDHYIRIQFNTALERYQILLESNPDITQRVSLGNIASYLGITRETLSRIRAVKV